MAMTGKKNITIDGADYTERVVPGWDVEDGYRLPDYPELGIFVKAFNWDYQQTTDNNGGEVGWEQPKCDEKVQKHCGKATRSRCANENEPKVLRRAPRSARRRLLIYRDGRKM